MFRPTYYYNNNKTMELRAGGCLFYKFDNKKMHVLLIKNYGVYEDFGGKTDIVDKCIDDTIIREVLEESNCLINEDELIGQLNMINHINHMHQNKCVYVKRSKYLLYIVEASENQALLTSEMFGDKEFHDGILRTVEWIEYDDMKTNKIKNNIHIRLLSANIFRYLDIINDKYMDTV